MIQALAVIIVIVGLLAVGGTLLSARMETGRFVTVAASLAVGLQVVVIMLAVFGIGSSDDSTQDAGCRHGSVG
jgi:hypothetical protein